MSVRKALRRRAVLRTIDFRDEPLGFYVDRFKRAEPFSFSRFGDGEWNAILGREGRNVDGHQYFPDLGERLGAALRRPGSYMYAMMDRAMAVDGPAIARYLARHRVSVPWYASDVFHDASRDGRLYPLVEALRSLPVVVVSSASLRGIDGRVFDVEHFIEVPDRDCWLEYGRIRDAIRAHASRGDGRVYALAASMASNVLIDELHPDIGGENWLVDFGSLWDIFVGVISRAGFDPERTEEIVRRNLGER